MTFSTIPMTKHTLNALKGWPAPHALDFNAIIDPGETVQPLNSGTVVSLNSSGNFVRGCDGHDVMPMFLFPKSDANDISNPGGDPSSDVGAWVAVNSPGECVALVADGAYELVSTEIIVADVGDMVPNALLTSPYSGASNAGLLGIGVKYVNTICGIVSRGIVQSYGQQAVAFWPHLILST